MSMSFVGHESLTDFKRPTLVPEWGTTIDSLEKKHVYNTCWWKKNPNKTTWDVQTRVNTPPKFNIAPEKWWLEGEFPFGIAYF